MLQNILISVRSAAHHASLTSLLPLIRASRIERHVSRSFYLVHINSGQLHEGTLPLHSSPPVLTWHPRKDAQEENAKLKDKLRSSLTKLKEQQEKVAAATVATTKAEEELASQREAAQNLRKQLESLDVDARAGRAQALE